MPSPTPPISGKSALYSSRIPDVTLLRPEFIKMKKHGMPRFSLFGPVFAL